VVNVLVCEEVMLAGTMPGRKLHQGLESRLLQAMLALKQRLHRLLKPNAVLAIPVVRTSIEQDLQHCIAILEAFLIGDGKIEPRIFRQYLLQMRG
jgi:hypothetical protein